MCKMRASMKRLIEEMNVAFCFVQCRASYTYSVIYTGERERRCLVTLCERVLEALHCLRVNERDLSHPLSAGRASMEDRQDVIRRLDHPG